MSTETKQAENHANGEKKKESFKRKVTRRTIENNYSRLEILDAIKHLLEKKCIPQRTEFGGINKLNKESLLRYADPWAMANIQKIIEESRKQKTELMTGLSVEKMQVFSYLDENHTCKELGLAIRGTFESAKEAEGSNKKRKHAEIPNLYSLKKHQLILAILNHPRCDDIVHTLKIKYPPKEKEEKATEPATKKAKKIATKST